MNQIHQIIDIARRYRTIDPQDALGRFFQEISEKRWLEIERDPPARLVDLLEHRNG